MKTIITFATGIMLAVASPVLVLGAGNDSEKPIGSEPALSDVARGHEQVAKEISGDHTAVVLQKGDKQFTVYGVVSIRAVGSVVEITVKNGEKYSVSAADIFFITNNGFKI
jgi:hypothetical protein